MAVSAHDVAAALRERLPGLPSKKLHKLLYYCQGHHVAAFGDPLFREAVEAWDMGPVVAELWRDEKYDPGNAPPRAELDEGQLNTVGYVVSRYGKLTGRDLELLSHAEQPWLLADAGRGRGNSSVISLASMRDYYATSGAPGEDEDVPLDSAEVAQLLRGAAERRTQPAQADGLDVIRARLARSA